jgi:RimJ/RimL family protein N-acetyltransferase
MPTIEPRTLTARDGRAMVVRCATADDAEAYVRHRAEEGATYEYLVTEPDEFQADAAAWAERFASAADDPGRLMLLAEVDGRIVGFLFFTAGSRRRVAHKGMFGMGVGHESRGNGVGRALLTTLLDWAAAHPTLEKICLGVFADNDRAIALYEKLGFAAESREPRSIKLGPGHYVEDQQMAIYVKPGVAPEGFSTWQAAQPAV